MSSLEERFAAHFGHPAAVLASAPGRLEVLGNHTDYNQGFVLSCAVSRRTAVALAPTSGKICRLKDFRDGSERTFSLDDIDRPQPHDWSNYIRGVITELRKRGRDIGAFDAAMLSDVPLSAGMSSSAALETAFGFAFREAFGIELDPGEWARVGQGVENNYLGLHTGLLDQFSSIFGREHALILSDFRSVEVLKTVPLPADCVITVVNSMKKHNLVDSEYNVRRADCESAAAKLGKIYPGVTALRDVSVEQLEAARGSLEAREFRRAAHVVGEDDRVLRGCAMLESGDVAGFGKLLWESHESSRTNFENSTAELDVLVELSKTIPGCLGARLSGGGFGGISIHLVKRDAAGEYGKRIRAAYRMRCGVDPEVIACEAGAGAQVRRI